MPEWLTSDPVCDIKLGEALRALIVVMSSTDGQLRLIARRSLVAIGKPAVPLLLDALSSSNATLRWEAAKALTEIRDESAAEALVAALNDEIFGVRWLAAEGLIALGRKGLHPLLFALLQNPDSGWLREGAHHVLRALFDGGMYEIAGPVLSALDSVVPSSDLVTVIRCTLDQLEAE